MMDTSINQTGNWTCVNFEINPVNDLLMSIYIITLILGIIFNLLTAWPIVQQIRNKNVLGVYLLSLSVSDLLYILTMPMWIYYYHHDHKWTFSKGLCKLAGFFYYSNMYISICLLCCISIDRCFVVTFPMRAKIFHRFRYAWIICGLVYILVMGLHILVLHMESLTEPLDQQRCYETYPMTKYVALFNFLRVAIGFLLPLLVLAVCYYQILNKVQEIRGLDVQGKHKIKLLSVGVIAIFAICFAPYHILLLLRSIAFNRMDRKHYCSFEQALHIYFSCTLALSSINSAVDPLLYVLVSRSARENMKWCCVGKQAEQS
ncbi:G protein-coupled receptor 184 [Electrophorus electricus]|uniref:G protein-coupled receptor 184 n=1 Tax=Electrophorus electricus TaxID=8005 RepID=UPI0015D00753|nr:G protein-coupled receptor 184 [Electrophorus electricus]